MRGAAGDGLLDTYEAERRAVGQRNVDWALFTLLNHLVLDVSLGLSPGTPPEAQVVALQRYFSDTPMGESRRARAPEVFHGQRIEFCAHDIEIGYAYDSGAVVPDGTPPLSRDPMGTRYDPTTRPGHRLPHAWLERNGERISTHDLARASRNFVALTGAGGEPWCKAARQAEEQLGVPVVTARIGSGGDYSDPTGVWASLRQVDDDGIVLVRPDNHIAFRSAGPVDDPGTLLTAAMEAVLRPQRGGRRAR